MTKKRIAILSYYFNNNYGGVLQALALVEVLSNMGFDVTYINLKNPHNEKAYSSWKSWLKRKILCKINHKYCNAKYSYLLTASFNDFINKWIPKTLTSFLTSSDFESYEWKGYDYVVVGSDQIWRADRYHFINEASLYFVPDDITRVAYAASFGKDCWEGGEELKLKFLNELSKFKSVSVREKTGVELCKTNFNVDAELVLDPTLLLDRSYYESISKTRNNIKNTVAEYVGVYVLDPTPSTEKIIGIISKNTKIPAKKFNGMFGLTCLSRIKVEEYRSIYSWIDNFASASGIITDSYHGVIFSIIFKKNFRVIVNSDRGEARIFSILSMFQLEHLIINKDSISDLVFVDIDWEFVYSLLERQKMFSLNFINKYIV